MGLHRFKDSEMLQLVFFWENVSVAAANREISVEFCVLLVLVSEDEDSSSGFVAEEGDGVDGRDSGGVLSPDVGPCVCVCPFFSWRILIMFSMPRMFGTR